MSLRLKLALGVVAATIAAGSGAAAGRSAEDVACGSVVTGDTTLTHDLTACPGTGLVVAGPNVTLDLGGHTVSGTGNGFGIEVRADGVTVQNGTVASFGSGIDGEGGFFQPGPTGVTIRDLTITENAGAGIVLNGGNGIVLHDIPPFPDVIADNVADGNGQLGITADFPGFDGGGNAAKHNGDPRECVNVSCAKNPGQAD